ncbi:MAG TPA: glutaredoxin family protein [Microbacteriaceae bacterium]
MSNVRYFGADWCPDCRRSKALMDKFQVEFEENDVEQSKEIAEEAEQLSGRKNIPVIAFEDGEVLVEPTDRHLHTALVLRGLITETPSN